MCVCVCKCKFKCVCVCACVRVSCRSVYLSVFLPVGLPVCVLDRAAHPAGPRVCVPRVCVCARACVRACVRVCVRARAYQLILRAHVEFLPPAWDRISDKSKEFVAFLLKV